MSTEWAFVTPDRVLVVPFYRARGGRLRSWGGWGKSEMSFRLLANEEAPARDDLVVDSGGMMRLTVPQYERLFPSARGQRPPAWENGAHVLLIWDELVLRILSQPTSTRVHENGYVRLEQDSGSLAGQLVVVSHVNDGVALRRVTKEPPPSVLRRYGDGASYLTASLPHDHPTIPLGPVAAKILEGQKEIFCFVQWGQALISPSPSIFDGHQDPVFGTRVSLTKVPGIGCALVAHDNLSSTLFRFNQCWTWGREYQDAPSSIVVSTAGDRVILEPLAEMVHPRLRDVIRVRLDKIAKDQPAVVDQIRKIQRALFDHNAESFAWARDALRKLPGGDREGEVWSIFKDLPARHHDGLLFRSVAPPKITPDDAGELAWLQKMAQREKEHSIVPGGAVGGVAAVRAAEGRRAAAAAAAAAATTAAVAAGHEPPDPLSSTGPLTIIDDLLEQVATFRATLDEPPERILLSDMISSQRPSFAWKEQLGTMCQELTERLQRAKDDPMGSYESIEYRANVLRTEAFRVSNTRQAQLAQSIYEQICSHSSRPGALNEPAAAWRYTYRVLPSPCPTPGGGLFDTSLVKAVPPVPDDVVFAPPVAPRAEPAAPSLSARQRLLEADHWVQVLLRACSAKREIGFDQVSVALWRETWLAEALEDAVKQHEKAVDDMSQEYKGRVT